MTRDSSSRRSSFGGMVLRLTPLILWPLLAAADPQSQGKTTPGEIPDETSAAAAAAASKLLAEANAIYRTPARPGRDFPAATRFFPEEARRQGITGRTRVRVCVDERGRLTGPPQVTDSSGYEVLDRAALSLARAGSGHYLPQMTGGKPERGCGEFGIYFGDRAPAG